MKRFILSALLLAFTSIFVFGCSDSGDDSSSAVPVVTPIDLNNPDSLVGTYEITFFWTDAKIAILTNDCAKSNTLGYTSLSAQACQNNENVTLTGEGTITKNENGDFVVSTKVQMNGGIFDNPNNNPALNNDFAKNALAGNIYNYTVYTPIPASTIDTTPSTGGLNATGSVVKGTTGRNITNLTSSPEDEYKFILQDDGTLLNEMTNNMVTAAEVRVIMKKKNDLVIALDENTPYTSPAITGFLPVAQ